MRRFACMAAICALAAGACAGRVRAQATAEYVLGPDDVIEITVTNFPDLGKTITVRPDGKISFPEAGELLASGKTPRQLGSEIQAVLEKTRNQAEVMITVKEVHSRQVKTVGAVKVPGSYALKPNWRLMDLVAVSGGLTAKPILITGKMIRGGTKLVPIDIQEAMAKPAGEANPLLQPDDLVIFEQIDEARRQVHVIGQVAKPGALDLQDGTSIVSLLSQAGNPTEKAALSKSYILRGKTRIPIDLRVFFGPSRPDTSMLGFALEPGDALVVPEIEDRFAVMGQVHTPSYYPVPETEELTVLKALSIAGGQTEQGDLAKAGVIRMVDGKANVIPVNINDMLKKHNMASNVTLKPNDILFVPPRNQRSFDWYNITAPLAAFSYLGLKLFR
jgi:polysaccharide biosynthesis/export protein